MSKSSNKIIKHPVRYVYLIKVGTWVGGDLRCGMVANTPYEFIHLEDDGMRVVNPNNIEDHMPPFFSISEVSDFFTYESHPERFL